MSSTEFADAINHLIVLGAIVNVTVSETINGEPTPNRTYKVTNIKADHFGYQLVLLYFGPMIVPFDTRFIITQQS